MKLEAIALLLFCFSLAACSNGSTESGVVNEADTSKFGGRYNGSATLEFLVDTIGVDPKKSEASAVVAIEVRSDGVVEFTIAGTTLRGTIDDKGNWTIGAAINAFGLLIDDDDKRALELAGCRLGEEFATIKGQVTSPNVTGTVSGHMSCKLLLIELGSLEIVGAVQAAK